MKFFRTTILIVTILSLFSLPFLTQASSVQDSLQNNLRQTGGTAYYDNPESEPTQSNPTIIIAAVIRVILSFLGILFVILIIVAGFQWMNAGGNSEQIAAARKRMINATIGVVIVLAVFSITEFLLDEIIAVVQQPG